MPERIQRRRTPGWRMPEGAVYVGRPSRWGNPFLATGGSVIGPPWFTLKEQPLHLGVKRPAGTCELYSSHAPSSLAVQAAVDLFRDLVKVRERDYPMAFPDWIRPLKGHDLACWCPLDEPCHADVLLEVANG